MLQWLKKTNKKSEFDCSHYIDLEMPCLIDPTANVTRQGSRMTLIRLNGNMNLLGPEDSDDFNEVCKAVLKLLKSFFNHDSVALAWMYEQDPLQSMNDITEITRPSFNAAKNLGLDTSICMHELIEANAEVCMSQEVVIALWTTPKLEQEYVNGKVVSVQTDNTPLKIKHDSLFKGSANPFLSDSQTIKAHRTNVDFATEVLRSAGIICDVIPAKKAAQWILIRTNSDMHKYTPLKFIDDKRVGQSSVGSWLVNPVTGDIDVSAFMAPPLSEQLARQSTIEERFQDGILRQGNRFYATHTVDVMPKQQISFNRLKKVLKRIPFRLTFLLKPKPTSLLAKVNESINRYLGGVSEMNKEYYRQIKLIGAMQEEFDYPPINLQILIVTWGDSVQDVMRLSHQINQSIVDWGGARMDYDNISPFQTFFSSIPGVNMISHSDGCLIGADKLVKLLPHQIESSLNEYGPLIFRHESGKICAYNPSNRYQDYDYTIFLARPRQGKSLLMNAKLIVSIMMEGASHFPLMTSMDIGPSSEGALQLLRLMLQDKHGKEQAKRMVVSQKWDPENGRWKVNPLDIRLGRTTPTNQEKMFIQNFYASVCAESETGIPVEGGVDVIIALVDKIYLELQEPHKSKRFNPAIAPRLTTLAEEYGIKTTVPNLINEREVEYKSYFELRDEFFIAGSMEGASLSHRLAMPTVDSLTELLSTDTAINKRFEKIYPGVIDKIRHKLQTHRSSMPHLANYTTLDFSDAHIISFDLKPIMTDSLDNSARIKLFAEYLLAMNIGMSKFFVNEMILDGMSPVFADYWRSNINKYQNVDKCLNLDEWHALTIKQTTEKGETISMPVAGAAYLEWLIKEAPKWRLNINQASHSASDFTSTMKEKATNVFIYSGTTGKELEYIQRDFSLNDTQMEALQSLHGPDAERGSQMLWLYTVNVPYMSGVRGSAKVEFLCKGSMLWGLNTSAKDLPHKLKLERENAGRPWLNALCEAFPNGSMEDYRRGLIELLRESDIAAEMATKGIEERLYEKTLNMLATIEYGGDILKDAEAIKKSITTR